MQRARSEGTRSAFRNLIAARTIALEWVDAGPGESRAHLNVASIDLLLGDPASADRELRQITSHNDLYARHAMLVQRTQAAVLIGHGASREQRVVARAHALLAAHPAHHAWSAVAVGCGGRTAVLGNIAR